MNQDSLRDVEKYIKTRQMKKLWYRVMSFLAAVVVFCTTYALILPAVTASSNPLNGDYAFVTTFLSPKSPTVRRRGMATTIRATMRKTIIKLSAPLTQLLILLK